MEEARILTRIRDAGGAALVIVLLAIAVLLPPTIVLATLALRWQRQAIDYRDTISQEFAAQAGFEEARNRVAADGLDLAAGDGSTFVVEELGVNVRVTREPDVVLAQDGRILEGMAASRADLEQTGIDAEGRVVYQFKKLEIYVVQVDVSRRPTLSAVRLYAVLAKLPEEQVEVLGTRIHRGYFESQSSTASPR